MKIFEVPKAEPAAALIALPIVLGYSLSAAFPFRPDGPRNLPVERRMDRIRGEDARGEDVPFRPPPWVFMVVWPVLYLLLGYSTYLARKDPVALILHLVLTAMINAWIPITQLGNLKEGTWLLLAAVLVGGYAVASSKAASLLLLPLMVWISFATLMNAWQAAAKAARGGFAV